MVHRYVPEAAAAVVGFGWKKSRGRRGVYLGGAVALRTAEADGAQDMEWLQRRDVARAERRRRGPR